MCPVSINCVWADVPGFGTIVPMPTRYVDPESPAEIWRRLKALPVAYDRSERSFAMWCGINYNQWNNYKLAVQYPSRGMIMKMVRRTGIPLPFFHFGSMAQLPPDIDEKLSKILMKDQ